MKRVKILLFSVVLITTALILTGCGAKIQGEIDLNADGSGTRYMVCTIADNDLSRLKGGEAALDEVLKRSMPGILTLKKTQSGTDTIYTFSYSFKNFNDYLSKTEKLIGRKPDSTFEISGGMFSKTFSFKEKDISYDLMKWAIDAVKSSKIEGLNIGNLYSMDSTEVVLDGKRQVFDTDINISNQKNFYVDSVKVSTRVNNLKNFSRTIDYTFTAETDRILNLQNDELQKYFSKLVPAGGKLEKKTEGSLEDYEISFAAKNINELNIETQKVALDERADLSLDDLDANKFSVNTREISDSIDFSNVLQHAVIKNGIKYDISFPGNFNITKIGNDTVPKNEENFRGTDNIVLTSSGGRRLLSVSSQGNVIKINAYIGIPNSNPFILKIVLIILLILAAAFLFIKFLDRKIKYGKRVKDENTWKFDPDWKVKINNFKNRNG